MLFGSEGRLVKIRIAEDLRWAEQRRLQRETWAARAPVLGRYRLWLLSRIGGFLIVWGERLYHYALTQARPSLDGMRLE
jgi:hypothetical protein